MGFGFRDEHGFEFTENYSRVSSIRTMIAMKNSFRVSAKFQIELLLNVECGTLNLPHYVCKKLDEVPC